jgi:nitrate reductase (NAD(P)H)
MTNYDASCWCFWSLQVPVSALAKSNVIQVCAMDESSNMQPRDMYPNATSMMNNWMFRVAVLREEQTDGVRLHFEHPTSVTPGAAPGWMERLKNSGQDPTRPRFGDDGKRPQAPATTLANTDNVAETPMTKPGVDRKITLEELEAQDKEHPWFVVRGEVYDGTAFLKDHPGGGDSILLVAGEDASEDFMAIHSADGRAQLAKV